jgi:hypothetical protein
MIKRIGIDINTKRVCDVQAYRCGIVAPGSSIGTAKYTMINNRKISLISAKFLEQVLNCKFKYVSDDSVMHEKQYIDKKSGNLTLNYLVSVLNFIGIKRTGVYKYQCPFHAMSNNGNLVIYPDGKLYCFHEQRCWTSIDHFKHDYYKHIQEVCKR